MDTKALRQKILDLAIRGKLVPQDPADEPASVLLERIRAEKQQMVKDGKLKAKDIKNDTVIYVGEDNLHYEKFSDGTVKCIEDEIPFEIPDSWAWARLGVLTELITSGSRGWAQYYSNDGALFLRMGNLSRNSFDLRLDSIQRVLLPTNAEGLRTRLIEWDLLFSITAEIGMLGLIPSDFEEAYINQHVGLIRFLSEVRGKYYPYILLSDFCREQYFAVQKGLKNSFRLDNISNVLIPVPTLQDQRRIVESLDVLFDVLKRIESGEKILFDNIEKAKSKILDLAIRGKLVPQDPADEPASVLLERIRADKEEQIKAGKIKRDKKESFIFRGEDNSYYLSRSAHKEQVDAQFLFPLPLGWQWCTLSNVSHFELGKTLDQGKNTGDYYPYLRSANIKWDSIDLADLKEMRFEKEELDRYTIVKNDLLICEGGDVGRCCVWESANNIMYQNALHRVRFFENCNPFFFMFYMWHYELEGMLKPICNGVTIKHLTGDVLRSIPFALPPVEEQNRIVAKIREYFQIIEVLQ